MVGFLITTVLSTYFVLSANYDLVFLRVMKYVFVLLILLKIIVFDLTSYSKKTLLVLMMIAACVFVSMLVSDNRTLALTFVTIVGAYGLDFRKILKWFLICVGGLFIIIVFLSVCGIVPDLVFVRDNGVIRHSLGFKWCATPAIFGWSLSMAYLYYRGKKIEWIELILILLINVLLFYLTGTRLELVCVILGVIAALMNKYGWLLDKKWVMVAIKNMVLFLPLIITIGSFLLAFVYNGDNEIMGRINGFTSGRLSLNQKGLAEYGLHLFGEDVEWVNRTAIDNGEVDLTDLNVIDNSYVSIFIRYGLIVGIIILSVYHRFGKWTIEKKNYLLQLLLIIVFAHSCFNPHLMTIPHNVFLLMMMNALVTLSGEKKNAKK